MPPRRVVLTFVMCFFMIAGGASAGELRALGSFRRGAVLRSGAGFAGAAGRVETMVRPFGVGANGCAESEPNDRLTQADPIGKQEFCTGSAGSGDSYDVSVEFRIEQKNATGTFVDVGPASANATTINVTGFSAGQTGTFRVRARNGFGNSAYSNEAWATTPDGVAACTPSSTTACLLGNRFRVAIGYRNQYSDPPGQTGSFAVQRVNPSAVNPDTAIFGFGSPQDVEVVVRLVDARPFAPRFDVYYGGLTDVEYTVTVTDTQTGTVRQYHNEPGSSGGAVDRTSFPAHGAASAEQLRALGGFGPDAVLRSGAGFAGEAGAVEAMGLPFVVAAGDCVESEPNDRLTQANRITSPGSCTGKAASKDSYDLTITYPNGTKDGIEDIWVVHLGYTAGLEVSLWATSFTSSNLDVFLFSAAGGSLELIAPPGNTSSNPERIESPNVLAPGTYYIGVSAVTGSANYTLAVSPIFGLDRPPAAPSSLTATATSPAVIRLNWNDHANNETEFRVEEKNPEGTFVDIGAAPANTTAVNVTGFSPGQTGTFRVRARNSYGSSAYSNEASATTPGVLTCTPSSTTICLLGNRFRVAIDYRNPYSNPPGQTGGFVGQRLNPSAVNPDTAIFGFSSPQDIEVIVRLVDARPYAPRFDVYYGGLTDVEYTVTVTDTLTGTIRQYHNDPGTVGGGVDRTSFPVN